MSQTQWYSTLIRIDQRQSVEESKGGEYESIGFNQNGDQIDL